MTSRPAARLLQRALASTRPHRTIRQHQTFFVVRPRSSSLQIYQNQFSRSRLSAFHTSSCRRAQSPTADALMEHLTELYSTAKDEFEIAAEETEKKTVYAADDREAAQEALKALKDAFEKAVKESNPEVGKEIQSRVGQRIRELENAVKAMEEMAMED
ncbi:hypothetical protein ABEF92_005990 [Exophiala dermatitidis]|uniref:Uncharacterized protein n=2 Tax=Exophiala dermatitidis TaxID=5970 RepID=H6BLT8_EXODN|nr:uncharacterized protein HMPREF1120_00150 [Exophiala dermatitidis NIH/UT8656]EHY51927.1 hypothetical protein HMPREF1120_00150 [Exophiala dermatitidis NIH/UT8656]KAJ4514601.1 hypothetical protein HRR75_003965 [Exophiala dermatitidis]KAJ4546049.1 hypothetical protein HRR78_005888 [Exophiala dermatitidis]KAJ4579757.1 hypothetical protein HRR82_004890 [Exophiala dermatitidis]